MKSLLALLALISTLSFSSAFADELDCKERLTNGFNDNSTTSTYNLDNYQIRDYGRDHLAEAIAVIRIHIGELGCKRKDINFGKGPWGRSVSRCTRVLHGVDSSRVCYVQSNLGYFFVTKGYLNDMVVTYHRWD